MRASEQYGKLVPIPDCEITVPGYGPITFRVLPEITDSHSSRYNDEAIIGRSVPIKTYSHGDNRVIGVKIHFITIEDGDSTKNLRDLRALQSLTYPQDIDKNTPFLPPPIAQIKCGNLLSSQPLCVVLDRYNVSFPTDVIWDEGTGLPWKFDVDLEFQTVFSSDNLPGSDMILED